MVNSFKIGRGKKDVIVHGSMLTRHGLISGASGSGKTVSIKVMAENLSKMGVPVILTDIKGDLMSLSKRGEIDENIGERIEYIGLDQYENRSFPIEVFDIYGKTGIPMRSTISEMGPVLLSKLLGLNDVQSGILNICFIVSDEKGYFLHDIKDLRAMLNYIYDKRDEYERLYGNITKQSIGAILRSLTVIERQGGDIFFGEPAFDINDLFRREGDLGIINIVDSRELFTNPSIYSTFLLWLLSELYENLPEVGDLDLPKLVFFFDEAHTLFSDAEKEIIEEIEQIVKLIRSKGVGIFFISQDPLDIPEGILGQLGNKIQHQLRANTPNELKKVRKISDTYKQDGSFDLSEKIGSLKKGQAIVSFMDEEGSSMYADVALISPPESYLGSVEEQRVLKLVNNSSLYGKYIDPIDSTSAYEILMEIKENELKRLREEEKREIEEEERKNLLKEKEREIKELEKKKKEEERVLEKKMREERRKAQNNPINRFARSMVGSMSRELGRQFTRGIFKIFKK